MPESTGFGIRIEMARLKVLLAGLVLGLLAAVVLTLVPLYGVRKSIEKLFLNWQEIVFVVTSVFSGALIGSLIAKSKLNLELDSRVANVKVTVAQDPGKEKFLPKKKRSWKVFSGIRSKLLFSFLYLLLYVNLSILCVYFRLGIVDIPSLNLSIRTVGVLLAMYGLYLVTRGVRYAKTIPYFVESSYYDAEIGLPEELTQESDFPRPVSHIPAVSLNFFSSHPIAKGWFFYLIGLPLVFQAWFPLIALPGIYIGLNWLFNKPRK